MSGSVNKVILVGNLGKDPEVYHTQEGKKIVTLSIATSESWHDKTTNEKQERTEWHRVAIFNENLAKVASQYLRKGSRVYLEGKLQTRRWLDNNGSENTTTEIILQKYGGEIVLLSRNNISHTGGEDFKTVPQSPKHYDEEFPF